MDIVTYKLSQKYADKVAAGFSSVTVDGLDIIFTLNDGKTATVTVPAPKDGEDGISITNVSIDNNYHLICSLSNGNSIDAGLLPKGADGTPGQPGNGIISIEKTGTEGLIDTYTIYFTNGTTTTFTVTNGSGGGGTSDYSDLANKPQINDVTLSGNKSLSDLGIQPAGNYLTSVSIDYSSIYSLTEDSTSEQIIAAFGGADKVDEIINAAKEGKLFLGTSEVPGERKTGIDTSMLVQVFYKEHDWSGDDTLTLYFIPSITSQYDYGENLTKLNSLKIKEYRFGRNSTNGEMYCQEAREIGFIDSLYTISTEVDTLTINSTSSEINNIITLWKIIGQETGAWITPKNHKVYAFNVGELQNDYYFIGLSIQNLDPPFFNGDIRVKLSYIAPTNKLTTLVLNYNDTSGLSSVISKDIIELDNLENSSNKVTSLSSNSTDTQYPSAKCVYDNLITKQDTLVSGTNIKTINNISILGSGNINISGGGGSSTVVISDTTWTLGTSISNAGAQENNKPTFGTTDYIEVSAGDAILYTGDTKDANNVDFRACIMFYNVNKTAIGSRQDLLNAGVVTDQVANSNGYIRLMYGRASATAITLTQNDIDTYCEITQTTGGGGGGTSITVVQSTGQSTTSVMSQKAVTDAIGSNAGNLKKYTPLCDYISVPNEVVGADHWQAIVKVGSEIWFMQQSSAVGGTVNGVIDRVSATDFSYIGQFTHNLGHFNCCEYDEQTDMLITGWASDNTGDPKKLLVFRNVLAWTDLPTGSELNYSNVDVTEINMTSYLATLTGRSTILGNAIWADRTTDGHRYAIVTVGNPTETFIKIMLGYGTDHRTYGTYTAAAAGVPNGTFSVSWVKTITMPYVQGCTNVKTMINQDAKYYKGGILMALSAIPVTALYLYEQNGSDILGFDLIRTPWADDNGVTQTGWNQGVLVMDDDIYIGIAPTTTGSTNPNKLAKFRI